MSVLLNAADIRDIHGPIHLPGPTPWFLYALCVLATPLIWWAARAIGSKLRARSKPLSAYELAKARLEEADKNLDQQQPDDFAEQVSGAVREYVEARFALPVTQRTSEEFLSELLTRPDVSPLLAAKRPELTLFLETCDLAKFAARSLHRETKHALSAAARQFIEAAEHAPAGAAS